MMALALLLVRCTHELVSTSVAAAWCHLLAFTGDQKQRGPLDPPPTPPLPLLPSPPDPCPPRLSLPLPLPPLLQLVPAVTELIIAEMLYLQYKDRQKPMYLYINSTGEQRGVGGGGVGGDRLAPERSSSFS